MRGLGLRAGLALNPDTPFEAVRALPATHVDLVLCMTVFPGFGGQSFIAEVMPKVAQVRAAVGRPRALASTSRWTAGIDAETAPVAAAAGANVFVAGQRHLRPRAALGGGRRHPVRRARVGRRPRVERRRAGRGGRGGHRRHLARARAGARPASPWTHLEADAAPQGASVRNFGLVWVSGRRSGDELDVAHAGPPSLGGAGRRGARPGLPARRVAHRRLRRRRARGHGGVRPASRRGGARHHLPRARGGAGPQPGRGGRRGRRAALHASTPWSSRGSGPGGAARAPGRPATRTATASTRAAGSSPPSRTAWSTRPGARWEGDLVVVATGAAYDQLAGHRGRWRPRSGGSGSRCSRRRRSHRA